MRAMPEETISITHEPDEFGHPSCDVGAHMGGEVSIPGHSTCGRPGCRDRRAEIRLAGRRARAPSDEAHEYAQKLYDRLDRHPCPGTQGHEGRGGVGSYCEACIVDALANAWLAGRRG
jgi:hypothetical protein